MYYKYLNRSVFCSAENKLNLSVRRYIRCRNENAPDNDSKIIF